MNLFSAQHSYRLGSDNQVDKRFVTLQQFVKYFKGSEPQYFYFEQKENGETDVSNWRFGVLFYVNGRKVQIKQPNTKDWLNRFTYKVDDNGSWGEGNKISTVESIEKQLGGKMKQLKNNAVATNVFMAIKKVCEEYGIECPSDVWNPFYQDLALAVNPSLFGETHANRSREKALAYDEGRSETKYRFASRQIKNEYDNPRMFEVMIVGTDSNGQRVVRMDKVSANSQEEAESIVMNPSNKDGYRTQFGMNDIKVQSIKEVQNSRKIESAKEEDCGTDACVLTPFGEIDRTVANADFTDESFEAYVVEPYAEESDGMFVTELETKGE